MLFVVQYSVGLKQARITRW